MKLTRLDMVFIWSLAIWAIFVLVDVPMVHGLPRGIDHPLLLGWIVMSLAYGTPRIMGASSLVKHGTPIVVLVSMFWALLIFSNGYYAFITRPQQVREVNVRREQQLKASREARRLEAIAKEEKIRKLIAEDNARFSKQKSK